MAEEFPFLEYASQQALYHANAAASVVSQNDFVSQFFTLGGVSVLNLFQKFKVRLYKPYTPPLYILADQGLENLIRLQMKTEPAGYVNGERYERPFFAALTHGHGGAVAALLGLPSINFEGSDITKGIKYRKNWIGFKGCTPLSWAAQTGRQGIVKAALQNGADPNEADKLGYTPLLRASRNDQEDIARLLIEEGADVNAQGVKWTALIQASQNGHEAIVRLLIEKGADVNAQNKDGWTALVYASVTGHGAVAQLLIEKGADVNAEDITGWTALIQGS